MSPPSRRSVLGALSLTAGSGFAGCSSLSNGDDSTNARGLPYSVSGAEKTFTTGSATIINETDQSVSLSLTISHEETTFFERSYHLNAGGDISVEDLTATAGEFSVSVDVENGKSTEYLWRVPERNGYPVLRILVLDGEQLLVGCGKGGRIEVTVANETQHTQTTTVRLLRDDEVVTEQSVRVTAGATTDVSLGTPIGDFYTLTTNAGGHATVADCYCYEQFRTTVTLTDDTPDIESTLKACA